jgi:hypothetical protein
MFKLELTRDIPPPIGSLILPDSTVLYSLISTGKMCSIGSTGQTRQNKQQTQREYRGANLVVIKITLGEPIPNPSECPTPLDLMASCSDPFAPISMLSNVVLLLTVGQSSQTIGLNV